MKKALQTILIVMMSLLALVSCSQEKAISDQLVSATLISTDRVSKALETEVDFDLSAVKLWKYTARKANGGLTTGQTELGEDKAETLTNGQTKGLSQGAWNFVLYGYDAAEDGNLIAQGSINNATVTETNHEVTITVNPVQTAGAKGKIVIADDIKIESTDGQTTYESGAEGYTMSYAVYKSSDTKMKTMITNLDSLDVGSYKVVVTFTGTVNGESYTAAKGNKVVNVYAGLTTTVKGTIKESEQAAKITQEGASVDIQSKTVTDTDLSSTVTMTANASPVGSNKTTEIVFPASSLTTTAEDKTLKLTVVATPVEAVASTYTVENSGTAVAGFDLTLEGATIADSLADDNGIKITTTIASGLVKDNLSVKFVGDSTDTKAKVDTYDPETGLLTFIVYHFSEYVITTTENIAYDETSFRNKIEKASTGEAATEIKIIDDITLSVTQVIDGGRNVKINLNGHTISAGEDTIKIENAKVEFLGKGTIQETIVNKRAPILVKGSLTDVADYTVVTIGEDVSLKGWAGIFMLYPKDNSGNQHSYGIVVNMKGSVTTTGDKYNNDVGIYFNGSVKDTDGNVAIFNLDGARIDARLNGIYAAGYAKWNIKNSTIKGRNAVGIEIRAGELNVESGTISSEATTFSCTANGNGSTTVGAAIAVAQHTTKKPIKVTISGGTFSGYHAMSVMNPQNNSADNCKEVSVTVTGGSFTATGKTGDVSVGVVNIASDYFVISSDAVYAPSAKFTVTAKTATSDV